MESIEKDNKDYKGLFKFYKQKTKHLQDENDYLNFEIERLKQQKNELENKLLCMFVENEQLVSAFDSINGIMKKAVEK